MDLTLMAVALPSSTNRLISLAPSDILIIVLYFVMVLGIGIYLKRYANTSNDFFMAGREMTAWVAGLSFLSANLGAIELMGWAASTYQYGILAAHFYWIAAFPSMVFLGLVMMPFYYISKNSLGPRLFEIAVRRINARFERNFVRIYDCADVGHQYVCDGPGDGSRARLEFSFQHLDVLAHRSCVCIAGGVVFGDLQ